MIWGGWRSEPGARALTWRRVADTVRRMLTHNAGLKLLSLLAAFALWFFVNAGERDTEAALQVPLEFRNIPATLMVVSPRLDFVDLRVSGPRTLLNRINRERLSMSFDLAGVRPGPAVFRVIPDQLDLPRGVSVVRLTPSEVTLEFAEKGQKRVPVHLALTGKPQGGLRVTETRVAPDLVDVYGPADVVAKIKTAETTPIDLTEAGSGLIEREVSLEPPREHVSYSAWLVHAQVRLEEPEETRLLKAVPVVVRGAAGRTQVRPSTVQITVRGPRSSVEGLELNHGAVYIDATDREPGDHAVKPTVDLPAGVELVKVDPASVQVRIVRERR
jgi:YbbR domain-containing protein